MNDYIQEAVTCQVRKRRQQDLGSRIYAEGGSTGRSPVRCSNAW